MTKHSVSVKPEGNTKYLLLIPMAVMGIVLAGGFYAKSHPIAAALAERLPPWKAMMIASDKMPGAAAMEARFHKEGNHWVYDVLMERGSLRRFVEVDPDSGVATLRPFANTLSIAKKETSNSSTQKGQP